MADSDKAFINYTCEDNIGTVEFYHPKGNSLPSDLLKELAQTITHAGKDGDNEVVVLRSGGKAAFCAGASFDELIAISNYEDGKAFFMGFSNVINAMRTCPKLIITRVHGKAVGGGVGIAAAADFAIGHTSASIKLSELAIGIGPFVVGPSVGRKIGMSAFSTLSIDAKNWYSAKWAHSKGLYNKLCDSVDDLDDEVNRLAAELAKTNPEAMRELKGITWQGTGHWSSTLEQRAEISGRLILSKYSKDFINNFKSK